MKRAGKFVQKQENNKNNFVVPKFGLESDLSEKMKSNYKDIKSESISSKAKFIGLKRNHAQENLDNKKNNIYLDSIKEIIISRNINKKNLPYGLLINTDQIDSTNADKYILNKREILLEEYSKILGNEGVKRRNFGIRKQSIWKKCNIWSSFQKK